jgi:translocation and assembly module TamB
MLFISVAVAGFTSQNEILPILAVGRFAFRLEFNLLYMTSKKKTIKWISIAVVVLGTIVCLAAIGTIALLNSSTGQHWLQDQLNTMIAGDITSFDLNISPINGTLELTNVVLKGPDGMDVSGFERFYLKVHWRSLLKKELRITELRLQKPWGRFYRNAAGRFNLLEAISLTSKKVEKPKQKPSSSNRLPINLIIDDFTIEKGDISFNDPSKGLSTHITGMNLWADGNLFAKKANLAFELDNLNLKTAARKLPPTRITAAASLDNSQMNFNDLNIRIGKSHLNLTGVIADIYHLAGLDIDTHLNVNLTELAQIFQLKEAWSGDAAISANVSGEAQNPNVNLNINLEKGVVLNRRLDRVQLAAKLFDRQLDIEKAWIELAQGKLNLTGQVDLKSAFADGFLKPPVDLDAITFSAESDHMVPDIGPWVPEVEGLKGKFESHLTLSGKGASIEGLNANLDLRLKGKELIAKGVDHPLKGHFKLGAQLHGRNFQLEKLEGEIDGIQLDGSGHYDLKKRAVTAALKLDAKDLSQPLKVFGLPDAKGALGLSLDLNGTLDQPRLNLKVNSNDLGYGDVLIGTVQLVADLNPEHIFHISSIKLSNQGSSLNGRAKVRFLDDWKGIDPAYYQFLELNLNKIEAHDFYHKKLIQGRLNGQLSFSGLLPNLKGSVKLDCEDLSTEKIRLGNFHTLVRLDGNLIKIEKLLLKNQESEVKGQGEMLLLDKTFGKIVEDPKFQFTLTSSKIRLENFFEKLNGNLAFDTNLYGTLKHPSGFVNLHGFELDTGIQKFKTIDVLTQIDRDCVTLAPLKIALSTDESLTLTGWANMNRTFAFKLRSTKIKLAAFDALKDNTDLKGALKIDISGDGSFDDPDIDGNLVLEELLIHQRPMEDINLLLSVHNNLARAYGNLNFDLDASYHLLNQDFTASLDFDQTRLDNYFKIANQPDMNGEISGQLKVKGNLKSPTDIIANLDLTNLALFFKKIPLLKTNHIKGHTADQRIFLDDTAIDLLSTGKLSFGGSAQLNGPIDFSCEATLPIGDAGSFSEALVDAKGDVNLSAKVTGSLPRPKIYGDLNLADIAVTVPTTGQRITKVNGKIRIDPKRITIADLGGMLDSGKFALLGEIDHDFFTPRKIDLKFNTDALPLEIPDTLSLLLNSRIQVTGENGKAEAKGEIVLANGSYYRDVNINLMLLESIGKRGRRVAPAAKPLELPFFKEITLNIAVKSRDPFLVQNNLADLEIQPDLSVGGTLSRPVVSGRADVTSGEITFKKNIFTVNKGVIDFVNPYKTEMSIDIESETEVRGAGQNKWIIKLTLKGTPNDLQLNLSSVPEETDADILSLLIFGKTREELSNGGTQSNTSARELLAGILADTLGDELKKDTGLDILEVETGKENEEEVSGGQEGSSDPSNPGADNSSPDGGDKNEEAVSSDRVKVTLGKHLSKRMTVKVAVESDKGEMVQRAISEYQFLDHILVSGFRDTKGVYGGNLIFQIEFR